MKRIALILLLLPACSMAPQEREAATIRTAIDAGRLGCGAAAVKRIELTAEQKAWCEGRP